MKQHIALWITCLVVCLGVFAYSEYSNDVLNEEMQRIQEIQDMKRVIAGEPEYWSA